MAGRVLRAGILVGGQSRRMGRSKALLPLGGTTLLEHIALTIGAVVSDVVLLGRPPEHGPLRLPLIDDVPGVGGPLGGILAALRADGACDWLIVATDMPLISRRAIEWLASQRSASSIAVVPRRAAGTIEPLFAIYTAGALPVVEKLARAGARSVRAIAAEPGAASPHIPPELEPAWDNVNTPEEWAAATLGASSPPFERKAPDVRNTAAP